MLADFAAVASIIYFVVSSKTHQKISSLYRRNMYTTFIKRCMLIKDLHNTRTMENMILVNSETVPAIAAATMTNGLGQIRYKSLAVSDSHTV